MDTCRRKRKNEMHLISLLGSV